MKKILFISISFFCSVTMFGQQITTSSTLSSEPIGNMTLQQNIMNFISANQAKLNSFSYNGQSLSFDFNNLRELKSDNVSTNIVTCINVNDIPTTSPGNNTNDIYDGKMTLSFIIKNNMVQTYSITFTTNNSTDKSLKYFDENLDLLYSVNVNEEKQQILVQDNSVLNRAPGCGQATMNCINHYYTSQGWFSVGLWAVTLFYPGAGVAVAGACALTCCTNTGCPQ